MSKFYNNILPTKEQWKKWSLPSKLTALGCYVGFLSLIITILIYFFPSNDSLSEKDLKFIVGNKSLKQNEEREIVIGVNYEETIKEDAEYIVTYLPVSIKNTSPITMNDVAISIKYPNDSDLIWPDSLTRKMFFGPTKEDNAVRKTFINDKHQNTSIFINYLPREIDFAIGEPIFLPFQLVLKTSLHVVNDPIQINILITAKNIKPSEYKINLIALSCKDEEELLNSFNSYKSFTLKNEIVNISKIGYLIKSIFLPNVTTTFVWTSWELVKYRSCERVYTSDRLENRYFDFKYDPYPISLIFSNKAEQKHNQRYLQKSAFLLGAIIGDIELDKLQYNNAVEQKADSMQRRIKRRIAETSVLAQKYCKELRVLYLWEYNNADNYCFMQLQRRSRTIYNSALLGFLLTTTFYDLHLMAEGLIAPNKNYLEKLIQADKLVKNSSLPYNFLDVIKSDWENIVKTAGSNLVGTEYSTKVTEQMAKRLDQLSLEIEKMKDY